MLLSSGWVKEDFGGVGGGRFSLVLDSGLDSHFLSPFFTIELFCHGTIVAASFFVLFLFFLSPMDPRKFCPASVSSEGEDRLMLLRMVQKAVCLL